MKVLLLNSNIASRMNNRVKILKDMGHDVRGIIFDNNFIQESRELNYMAYCSGYNPLSSFKWAHTFCKLAPLIKDADIVHWMYGQASISRYPIIKLIKFHKKPAIVEFCGSDIRIPSEIEDENPYIMNKLGDTRKNEIRSIRNQKIFSRCGFNALTFGHELERFIRTSYFSKIFKTRRFVNSHRIEPSFPKTGSGPFKIIHAPSNKTKKGSVYIEKAINELKNEFEIDFYLIHKKNHDETMKILRDADIVIDQMVIGDFGTFTLEAMAHGKPVICYLAEYVASKMPNDNPIIRATSENLYDVLKHTMTHKNLQDLGKASRNYLDRYHDPFEINKDLIKTYKEIIDLHKT